MAQLRPTFTAIANAIRKRNGTTAQMTPEQMPTLIEKPPVNPNKLEGTWQFKEKLDFSKLPIALEKVNILYSNKFFFDNFTYEYYYSVMQFDNGFVSIIDSIDDNSQYGFYDTDEWLQGNTDYNFTFYSSFENLKFYNDVFTIDIFKTWLQTNATKISEL